jgi:ribosome-associated protein
VSRLIVVTDVFIMATGTSRRHVLTLAEAAEEAMEESGRKVLRREGVEDAKWLLLDFGDLVVHVFDQFTRDFYDLERLWSDAPRLAVAVSAP